MRLAGVSWRPGGTQARSSGAAGARSRRPVRRVRVRGDNLVTAPDTVPANRRHRDVPSRPANGRDAAVSRGVTQAAADDECRSPASAATAATSCSRRWRRTWCGGSGTGRRHLPARPGNGGHRPPDGAAAPGHRRPQGHDVRLSGRHGLDRRGGARVAYSVERHSSYRTSSASPVTFASTTSRPGRPAPRWPRDTCCNCVDDGRRSGISTRPSATRSRTFSASGAGSISDGREGPADARRAAGATAIAWSPGGRYAAYATRDPTPPGADPVRLTP